MNSLRPIDRRPCHIFLVRNGILNTREKIRLKSVRLWEREKNNIKIKTETNEIDRSATPRNNNFRSSKTRNWFFFLVGMLYM